MANPNQDLTGIPLAEAKQEFDKGNFFHQVPPPIALIKSGSGSLDEGTTKMNFFGGGGSAADHYERWWGGRLLWEIFWAREEDDRRRGMGRTMGIRGHVRRREGRWDSHPRYMRETWRDHDNHYVGQLENEEAIGVVVIQGSADRPGPPISVPYAAACRVKLWCPRGWNQKWETAKRSNEISFLFMAGPRLATGWRKGGRSLRVGSIFRVEDLLSCSCSLEDLRNQKVFDSN
ncbi:hypothetical protein MA16_Dca001605 [Dendrobium catenatum]|uniref:Uncharacterized protein n=1 Tax=Dendrobium catenatum TaxID=906689 RepID=A0A2I0WMW1_9ASPA|nr:hypothetical protein MA16_Dca001605 [Dendrobium catenatum]